MASEREKKSSRSRSSRRTVRRNRPYINMLFACCNVYSHIYINKNGTAYQGYCPRCLKRVHLTISRYGSLSRFFIAN